MKEPGGQPGGEAPSPQVHPEATIWPEEPKESRGSRKLLVHDALAVCRVPGLALLPYSTWHSHPSKINFWEETKHLAPILGSCSTLAMPPAPHWEILGVGGLYPCFTFPVLSFHFEKEAC